jgi:hypothetical protein
MGLTAKTPAAISRHGRTRVLLLGLLVFLIAVLCLISPALLRKSAARERIRLPAAALAAIREIFPQAAVSGVRMDEDGGVTVFVVEAKVADKYVEVVASADGVVVEVSIPINAVDAPEAVLAAIRTAADGARITEIDAVGTHAEASDGRLVKLPVARNAYWAEFEKGALGGEVSVAPDGTVVELSAAVEARDVPEAALAAIRKAAGAARITEIDRDETRAEPRGEKFAPLGNTRIAYWAEFEAGELTGEVTAAPDGTVVEVSTEIEARDVPEAALAAIRKAAAGATITQLGRDETWAELDGGRLVKLRKAEVYYWAEFQKDDLAGEVSVAPDGAVAEVLMWNTGTETAAEGPKRIVGPRPPAREKPPTKPRLAY